ncbi:zinc knuckle CX2CX4HX4C containing protein [Tanacetum coccineum]
MMSDGNVHTQSLNEDKTVKIMGDLLSSSFRVSCVPGMANVVALLGVPLNTLRDIDNLTKSIDLGKLEVWSDLTSEKHSGKSYVVAKFFNVSLTTLKDIDDFTKDLELGKYAMWSEMTRDMRKEVLDNISTRWNALVAEYIHEKPSSYIGTNVSIPRKVVETVSTRFANTLYGYFIGKHIAFPVVEYYIRNNWDKYGLTRIMMNSKGFFFFQFKTLKGLEDVLENGPWMTRNSPIILKKWSMNTRLCKEELTCISVWVKIHNVPIHVFSEDGLSIIASHIVKPIMLDSYTSSMCIESWGRRYTIVTITIEYEWKPPRCDLCKIFGHIHDHCPKKVSSPPTIVTSNVVTLIVDKTNDGFQTVGKKEEGYEPKVNTNAPKNGATNASNSSKSSSLLKTTFTSTKKGNITMSNSYSALDDEDDEEVENVYDESDNIFQSTKTVRSSSTFTYVVG